MPRPTIYLFDVDGTLITSGGAGRRAVVRVFAEVFGRDDAASFGFGGMTDRAILRRGLTALGLPAPAARIDALLEAYLPLLAEEVARAGSYGVHAGVRAALDALAGEPWAAVGLGTGNVERGARIKLERVDLNRYFTFGGFGCDDEDRARLVGAGAARGAAALGVPLAECRVVVIGDTVKDVAAARANGAECLAVTTGAGDAEGLRAAGATRVFRDLAEEGALDALLGPR